MDHLEGSLITNTIISQVSEFTAYILSSVIYLYLGPKPAFLSMYLLSVIGSGMLIKFWTDVSLIPIFITMAKFGISACFNMVFIASVELVPTLFTASAFGFCNVSARMVTMMSSLVAELPYPVPLVVNMIVALIAAVAS